MVIRRRFLAVPLLFLAAGPSPATLIDWEDGAWSHGGPPATGYVGGSPTGTTLGGLVTVSWDNFGSATGVHASLGGTQPQVRADFNGSATDGALSIATSGDRNPGGTLVNFSSLTIVFTSPVTITDMLFGDVDRGGASSWQDFFAVEGRLGGAAGALRLTTYGVSLAQNTTLTYLGLSGVYGNNGNVAFDSDAANVSVSFDGSVDHIRVYFLQSPGVTSGTGAQHGIWLRDIGFNDASVPEPGTFALGGAGLALLAIARRFRARRF